VHVDHEVDHKPVSRTSAMMVRLLMRQEHRKKV
jgi:hypothetical protein